MKGKRREGKGEEGGRREKGERKDMPFPQSQNRAEGLSTLLKVCNLQEFPIPLIQHLSAALFDVLTRKRLVSLLTEAIMVKVTAAAIAKCEM